MIVGLEELLAGPGAPEAAAGDFLGAEGAAEGCASSSSEPQERGDPRAKLDVHKSQNPRRIWTESNLKDHHVPDLGRGLTALCTRVFSK